MKSIPTSPFFWALDLVVIANQFKNSCYGVKKNHSFSGRLSVIFNFLSFLNALSKKRETGVEWKIIWSSLGYFDMFLTLINILYSYDMVYDQILYFELNFLIKSTVIVWNVNQFFKNMKVSKTTSNSRSFYTSPTFVAQSI